jgi:cytochrome c biogenesis factor
MAYQPVQTQPHRGLGIAALILGIAALITLLICGLGVVVAVAGLIVGIIAVARNNGRGMAVAGIVLSAVTLVIAIAAGVWFYTRIAPCADRARYPTKADRDHCLQIRVPFFRATTAPSR